LSGATNVNDFETVVGWLGSPWCLSPVQGVIVRQCFDPRIDLTFESEEEARARNRELVGNWKEAQDPEIKLYEWPT
jgi:hypothetical protein